MRCPYCLHTDSRVLETRTQKDGELRRRRQCAKCESRFSTIEGYYLQLPQVIKKDGRRETFSLEKLKKGIQLACRKRPVSVSQIDQIVRGLGQWAEATPEKELDAQIIGQRIILELKKIDSVAYVRFASVYKSFSDLNEFAKCLEQENPNG